MVAVSSPARLLRLWQKKLNLTRELAEPVVAGIATGGPLGFRLSRKCRCANLREHPPIENEGFSTASNRGRRLIRLHAAEITC
jgi:hypothetical protein